MVQTANRVRLVMNLVARNLTYTQAVDGRQLIVTIDGSQGRLRRLGFHWASAFGRSHRVRRGRGGQQRALQPARRRFPARRERRGLIVVDLSDAATGIDIRQQGKTLIVDFIKTSLPRNLERRLDVAGLRHRRSSPWTRSARAAMRGW